MAIILRAQKGSPLTNNEVDGNFTDLDGRVTAAKSTADAAKATADAAVTPSALQTALDSKVDKVTGKQLSTEDFTTGEKNKLAGIAAGATANSSNASLLNRANHTGTQLASTISNFAATALSVVLTGLSVATGTAVIATDSILVAIGKLQAQLNGLIKVSSTSDVTAGRLVTTGWMGLGGSVGLALPGADANADLPNGRYITTTAWTGSPYAGTAGSNQGYLVSDTNTSTAYVSQKFSPLSSSLPTMRRFKSAGVWGAWDAMLSTSTAGTAAYLTATTSSTDATSGRAIKVGDFGIGSNAVPQVTDFIADVKPGWYYAYGDLHAQAAVNAPPGSGNGAIGVITLQGIDSVNYKTFLAASQGGSGSQDLFVGSRWSAAAPSWRRVITDANAILDPALNSGGIVFSGSNANGEYTKFADGTMICAFRASATSPIVMTSASGGYYYGAISVSFPAPFIAAPKVTNCTASAASLTLPLYASAITGSGCTLFQGAPTSQASIAHYISYTAIGRWKA